VTDAVPPGDADPASPAPIEMPSSQPIFMKALRVGGLATLALLVICGGIGWMISGDRGLVGGILGAAFAGIFLGLTIASIAIANRMVASGSYVVIFFAVVVGGWLLKFIAFFIAARMLRDAPWLDPKVLFFSLVGSVLISLVIDVFLVQKSRLPYISDPSKSV